jgi:hypothetical protein
MKQKDVVKKIRKLGYKVTVLNASSNNRYGIPDCMVSVDGKPLFIEIKVGKDKPTKMQKEFAIEYYNSVYLLHYDPKEEVYGFEMLSGLIGPTQYFNFIKELVLKLNAK